MALVKELVRAKVNVNHIEQVCKNYCYMIATYNLFVVIGRTLCSDDVL